LLLVVVTRSVNDPHTLVSQQLAALHTLSQTTHLHLRDLAPDDIARLVASRLGVDRAQLPTTLTNLVYQRAGGNPFFAEELVADLLEKHTIHLDTDPSAPNGLRCSVTADPNHLGADLPSTIQGVILSRLDRLPPETQLILKVASVIGIIFGYYTLRDVLHNLPNTAAGHLENHLDDLITRAMTIIHTPNPNLHYSFRHVVMQETVYQTLTFERRRDLHRAVVNWYEHVYHYTLESYATLLIYHAGAAGDHQREQHYARLAGESLAARYANDDAVTYLTRALALTDEHDYAERTALLLTREQVYDHLGNREAQARDLATLKHLAAYLDDPQQQTRVSLRAANYHLAIGEYATACADTRHAITVAEDAPEQDASLLAEGYLTYGRVLLHEGAYQEAYPILEQALTLTQQSGQAQVVARCLLLLAAITYHQSDYATACTIHNEALNIFRRLEDRRGEAETLNALAADWSEQGDYAQAIANATAALAGYDQVGDQRGRGAVLGNLADLYHKQGAYLKATTCGMQALDICRAIGNQEGTGHALGLLGWIAFSQGDDERAMRRYDQALQLYRSLGARGQEGWMLASLGFLAHRREAHTRALDYGQQAYAVAQLCGQCSVEADAWMVQGHALAALHRLDEANTAYREALTIWEQVKKRHRTQEALAGLAQVHLAQGNHQQARHTVEQILGSLEHGSLDGANEPFRVYLTCYQVLRASGDTRAAPVLQSAFDLLTTRAEAIPDPHKRQRFLERVPVHRALLAAVQSHALPGHDTTPPEADQA
jgi:predicted ATPase